MGELDLPPEIAEKVRKIAGRISEAEGRELSQEDIVSRALAQFLAEKFSLDVEGRFKEDPLEKKSDP